MSGPTTKLKQYLELSGGIAAPLGPTGTFGVFGFESTGAAPALAAGFLGDDDAAVRRQTQRAFDPR